MTEIYKFSNVGGFKAIQRYASMLAGNTAYSFSGTANYLVVAGGGGSGNNGGGGGGAGGVRYSSSFSIRPKPKKLMRLIRLDDNA